MSFSTRPCPRGTVTALLRGVQTPMGTATALAVRRVARDAAVPLYHVTLVEGKNREVRLMFRAVGRQVVELQRVRLGSLGLQRVASRGVAGAYDDRGPPAALGLPRAERARGPEAAAEVPAPRGRRAEVGRRPVGVGRRLAGVGRPPVGSAPPSSRG